MHPLDMGGTWQMMIMEVMADNMQACSRNEMGIVQRGFDINITVH